MNPDADINVVTVTPDGTARVYGSLREEDGARQLIRVERFTNYGQAKAFADEYEAKQREERARKGKS